MSESEVPEIPALFPGREDSENSPAAGDTRTHRQHAEALAASIRKTPLNDQEALTLALVHAILSLRE